MSKLPRGLSQAQDGYRIQFTSRHSRPGQRYRERLPIETTRRQAETYLAKLREDDRLGQLRWPGEKRSDAMHAVSCSLQTFVLDEYIPHVSITNAPRTVESKRYHLQALAPWFFSLALDDIDAESFLRYQRERKQEGVADRTVNAELTTLYHALQYAHQTGKRRSPPPRIKRLSERDRKPIRALTLEEVERALQYALERGYVYYALTWILATTGLRWGEVRRLEWRDVDLERRLLHVRKETTKTAEPRHIPLQVEDCQVLTLLPRVHELVFVREYRGEWLPFVDPRVRDKRSPRGSYYPWEGPDGDLHVGPHTFRHTAATHMLLADLPLAKVQRILGHRRIEMTADVYGHIEASGLHEDVARIPRPVTQRVRPVADQK